MTLSEELAWRGFVKQTTFADLTSIDNQQLTFYIGFDASADSQTVGNLAGMMVAKTLLRHGNKAVLLAGGATSLIGDPGGKDIERPLQAEETIAKNIDNLQQQLMQVFRDHEVTLVNNLDWTKDMQVIPFLRDIGKHYSMTPLIQRDYIATRLGEGGSGISYTEFSYTILQGMDYLYLYDNHGVTLQLGGSDQWGNCLSGVDLIRRARGQEAHVLSYNLVINKATGKKFGKTEDGAIWLSADKTSVYQFYQFWLNVEDDAVEDYLKIYTELDKPTIDELMASFSADRASRIAQKRLAYEVTKLVHGEDRAESVHRVTAVLFGNTPYSELTTDDFEGLRSELPQAESSRGDHIMSALVNTGLASSNSDAQRFLQSGAVYLNGQTVAKDKTLQAEDRLQGDFAILRRGKNTNALVTIKD